MHIYFNATVDVDKETAEAYEYAIDEDTPLEFPLGGCQVVWNGDRATISVARPEQPDFILDRLIEAAEPKKLSKGKKELMTLTGQSEYLHDRGVADEHGVVTFTITEWSAGAGGAEQ